MFNDSFGLILTLIGTVAFLCLAWVFCAALRDALDELPDNPRGNRTDSNSFFGSDNLKTSFHSSANSGEAQHDHA